MSANDERVPNHYQAPYLHWDLVHQVGMGYFEGCASKYISRWRKKGGRADLEKAQHYLAKLRELVDPSKRRELPNSRSSIRHEAEQFAAANRLNVLETQLVVEIALWQYVQELDAILQQMPEIIEKLDADWRSPPVRQEENNHANRTSESLSPYPDGGEDDRHD